jgi:restriction endonuclease S subunit
MSNNKEWKNIKLEDLCLIERGGSPRPIQNFITKDTNGINWIKIGDAKVNSKYIDSTNEKITSEGTKYSRKVKKGELILSNSMSFGRPYILNIDGCIHDGWLVLSDFSKNIDRDFLYYVLSSSIVKEQFKNEARGAIVQNLNIDIVKKVFIPLPPLDEQKRIAKIIETKLNAVEKAKKSSDEQIVNCDLFKDKLYEKIFNEYKDFEKVELENLCLIERGGSPRPIGEFLTKDTNGINWIKIGDAKINSKYIDNTNEKIISEGSEHSRKVKKGDFILSNSMSFGRPYILNIDGCIHDGWLVLSDFSNKINKDFLYYILSSSIVKKQFEKEARGAIVKNLNINIVKKVIIPLPELNEQERIVNFIEAKLTTVERIRDLLTVQSTYINALSSSILRKAFNGEY